MKIHANELPQAALEIVSKIPVRFVDGEVDGKWAEVPVYMPKHHAENIVRSLAAAGLLQSAREMTPDVAQDIVSDWAATLAPSLHAELIAWNALKSLRDRLTLLRVPTREQIAQTLCRGSEQNGGMPWDGLDKFNRGHFYDQADCVLALFPTGETDGWRPIKHADAENYKWPWDCDYHLICIDSNPVRVCEAIWHIPYEGAPASRGWWEDRGRGAICPEFVTHARPLPAPPKSEPVITGKHPNDYSGALMASTALTSGAGTGEKEQ